ncbi:MAG: response regulator [Chloroflexi bacterium]|nr:MAG: response regulator [Chloroflexota bacterium]
MTNESILVVDDNPTDLNLIVSLLSHRGYRVLTAVDGEEAVAKASEERPRLVVLDIVLPGASGYQICRQLKTAEETRESKVILVSGKDQASDRFWGMRQGADEYVTKPFTSEQLLAAVDRQL